MWSLRCQGQRSELGSGDVIELCVFMFFLTQFQCHFLGEPLPHKMPFTPTVVATLLS